MAKGKICMIDVVPWHLTKSLGISLGESTMKFDVIEDERNFVKLSRYVLCLGFRSMF
jgi:hypothetical protein